MSIAFNDNIDVRAPKHIDARAIVGSNPLLLYDTKELIPESYRYEALKTFEDDTKKTWKLVGGITDAHWVEVTDGETGIITFSSTINSQVVDLGDNSFENIYTILFYNGIFIKPNNYSIIGNELRFTFLTEADDEVYLIGFTQTIIGVIGGGGGSGVTPYRQEFLTPTNGQTVFTLINELESTAAVYKNGILMMSNEYSGTGTTTLTLIEGVTPFDTIVIIGNIISS